MDIVIIGGGPAALALGYELRRRGLQFVILERGPAVGDSWSRMPTSLKLVSPWKTNWLPGSRNELWHRHRQVTRAEFIEYLSSYAREHRLPVQTDSEVMAVSRETDNSFRVLSKSGETKARFVVNATGYFSHPVVPRIPGASESDVPQVHVANYRNPEHVKAMAAGRSGPILIVGHRLSAGQTMLELATAGMPVALSHRSPLKFGVGPVMWWIFYRIFPWLEWLRLKRGGSLARSTAVLMEGGKTQQLIADGTVKTYPSIRGFEGNSVRFEDGSTLEPALVIYATGFQPALQHLANLELARDSGTGLPRLRELESVAFPGLFFIGLDNARNFQSRFLRGIRKDAAILADRLQMRLQGSATSSTLSQS